MWRKTLVQVCSQADACLQVCDANVLFIVLGAKDVAALVEILTDIASKWRDIGQQLGFTVDELNNISYTKEQGANEYFRSMLNKWVHRNCAATLDDLQQALRSKTVDRGTLADKLDQFQALGEFFFTSQPLWNYKVDKIVYANN